MAETPDRIHDIDVATIKRWLESDAVVLVDVQDAFKHAAEHIPLSTLNPLSSFDPEQLPEAPGKRAVLYCNSGNRSRTAAKKWLASGADEVFHLMGGIQAWKQAGEPVERARKAPIDLMRQVQVTTGSLVMLGVALALLVTPWALLLSALVGVGLAFAGVSGFCGMASILGHMPWNRRAAIGGATKQTASDAQAA